MPAGDPPLTLRDLDNLSVSRVRNAEPKAFPALARTGINTILDLLQHYPRRYLDRTRRADVAQLLPEEEAYVVGEVIRVSKRNIRRGRSLVTMILRDDTGAVELVFFNQPWIADKHAVGETVIAHGRSKLYRGRLQMSSPVIDRWGDRTGRLVPVYPQSRKAGLDTWSTSRFIALALRLCGPRGIADPVPSAVLHRLGLITREQALNWIHQPDSMRDRELARRRLVFDELLRVQLELVRRKYLLKTATAGFSQTVNGELVRRFHRRLPFTLTAAQQRVTDEIAADMAKPHPMHRLLQGDVGSGKTVVALSALLAAVQDGRQGALMSPTEVLSEQHFATISGLLDGLTVADPARLTGKRPLRVELLSGQVSTPKRREVLAGLVTGSVDIVVGTHALISEGVEYKALGVVVIDEQHRFGVEQRAELSQRSSVSASPESDRAGLESVSPVSPDSLVMTATPIPRTAAMTVYGDLDVSTLDDLPPGRKPVITKRAQTSSEEAGVWRAIRRAVSQGRQAYVVCPIIEESESLEVRSAIDTYERLTAEGGALRDLRVGLLHGRVPAAEKEATMRLFRDGRLDVLVATTVIEVGVDVPNATVIAVIDAHRFGIAQLHQLRGRVGRGHHDSICYLMGEAATEEGHARLEAVASTTDGFELAEVDLELRGEGTIMGERQKGRSDLRLASLRRDKQWVAEARRVATSLLDTDVTLDAYPGLADEIDFVFGDGTAAEFLLKS